MCYSRFVKVQPRRPLLVVGISIFDPPTAKDWWHQANTRTNANIHSLHFIAILKGYKWISRTTFAQDDSKCNPQKRGWKDLRNASSATCKAGSGILTSGAGRRCQHILLVILSFNLANPSWLWAFFPIQSEINIHVSTYTTFDTQL